MQKFILTERMSCIAVSPSGMYLAAGSYDGKISLWELTTGDLVGYIANAHYKQVTAIRFTGDSTCFVSGSNDSSIRVWMISSVVKNLNPSSKYLFTEHSLPITDLYCTSSLFSTTRLFSCSSDTSLKVYDLSSGSVLTSFSFPEPVTTITVNTTQTIVFVGSSCGKIYRIDLNTISDSSLKTINTDFINNTMNDVIGKGYFHHTKSINGLSLSIDESLLVSGSDDGKVVVWDIKSLQPLRIFESHRGNVED
jgi:pre-rRNA-processing protein IPI3